MFPRASVKEVAEVAITVDQPFAGHDINADPGRLDVPVLVVERRLTAELPSDAPLSRCQRGDRLSALDKRLLLHGSSLRVVGDDSELVLTVLVVAGPGFLRSETEDSSIPYTRTGSSEYPSKPGLVAAKGARGDRRRPRRRMDHRSAVRYTSPVSLRYLKRRRPKSATLRRGRPPIDARRPGANCSAVPGLQSAVCCHNDEPCPHVVNYRVGHQICRRTHGRAGKGNT